MSEEILDHINSPADIKGLSYDELTQLAVELRAEMVAATSFHGGHLASSLGAVELIIALHRVLDCPKDKLVFDVGHQAYAHKLLTGRRERFATLRMVGGVSGFPKITESPYDAHDCGHASDALSVALGYALARDLDGGNERIAALVGDAAFTGGMSMEALNAIGHSGTRILIVLNDNGMSISKSVGAFATHLSKVRLSKEYASLRNTVSEAVESSGKVGKFLMDTGNAVKGSFKQLVLPGAMFFEQFGAVYIGPVDGHDIAGLEEILSGALDIDGPVVVHAITNKGEGYEPAEKHPDRFHGVGPFDVKSGKLLPKDDPRPSWTSVFSDELVRAAADDTNIVAITAAMASGTGLMKFAKAFPERFFDVGIAEENAVGMASSLALAGKTPVVAIYSTFLQRAYDQMIINVCLQHQHVIFCLDRAGLVGEDGPTHHGAFDLSYLRTIPNMRIIAPSDAKELRRALRWALAAKGPIALRYPRGSAPESIAQDGNEDANDDFTQARKLREGSDAALLAVGRMVENALEAAKLLSTAHIECAVWDMRWVKPVDTQAVHDACSCGHIFTLEDNSITAGFGSAVLEILSDKGSSIATKRIGLPDRFVLQGPVDELFARLGLDAKGIAKTIEDALT